MHSIWKKLLPFWAVPAHWGLSGDLKEKAKILWEEDDDYIKEKKLLEIDLKNFPEKLEEKLLELDYRFGKLNEKEYKIKQIEINKNIDEREKKKLLLKMQLNYGEIDQNEYEKRLATIDEVPWVKVLGGGIIKRNDNEIELELDWNDFFIKELRRRGYKGITEADMVDEWLNDIFKSMLVESGYNEFSDENFTGSLVRKKELNENLEEYE